MWPSLKKYPGKVTLYIYGVLWKTTQQCWSCTGNRVSKNISFVNFFHILQTAETTNFHKQHTNLCRYLFSQIKNKYFIVYWFVKSCLKNVFRVCIYFLPLKLNFGQLLTFSRIVILWFFTNLFANLAKTFEICGSLYKQIKFSCMNFYQSLKKDWIEKYYWVTSFQFFTLSLSATFIYHV